MRAGRAATDVFASGMSVERVFGRGGGGDVGVFLGRERCNEEGIISYGFSLDNKIRMSGTSLFFQYLCNSVFIFRTYRSAYAPGIRRLPNHCPNREYPIQ